MDTPATRVYQNEGIEENGANENEKLSAHGAVNRISVSPTMAVLQEAEKYKAKGVDVVDFGPGEPDFPTPEHIKRAAIKALEENRTKYTADRGHRAAAAGHLRLACGAIWDRRPRISPRSASSRRAASMRSSTPFARW